MRRFFIFIALLSTHAFADATAPPASTPQPSPSRSTRGQLFHIVLVRGSIAGPEEIVGIPKNAEKAIRDIRDFLPFKSYRVLDSNLIRTEENSMAKVRVDGVPPQQYDINIIWKSAGAEKLSIWDFTVYPVALPMTTPLPKGVAPVAEERLISTSFSIDIGETIVVGSSKLGGDQALIFLVTAVPAR